MELWEHHEEWAEREAKFCDQMVEQLQESGAGWQEKGFNAYSAVGAQMAYECAVRATVWKQMADNLRRPRRIRLEREAET